MNEDFYNWLKEQKYAWNTKETGKRWMIYSVRIRKYHNIEYPNVPKLWLPAVKSYTWKEMNIYFITVNSING